MKIKIHSQNTKRIFQGKTPPLQLNGGNDLFWSKSWIPTGLCLQTNEWSNYNKGSYFEVNLTVRQAVSQYLTESLAVQENPVIIRNKYVLKLESITWNHMVSSKSVI